MGTKLGLKEKRKFGDKTYIYIHTRKKKSLAKKDVEGIREKGGLGRVVPFKNGYAVYGRMSR